MGRFDEFERKDHGIDKMAKEILGENDIIHQHGPGTISGIGDGLMTMCVKCYDKKASDSNSANWENSQWNY